MMTKKERSEIAKKLGAFGGAARARKHGKKQLSEWAKKGGRPRKRKIHDIGSVNS